MNKVAELVSSINNNEIINLELKNINNKDESDLIFDAIKDNKSIEYLHINKYVESITNMHNLNIMLRYIIKNKTIKKIKISNNDYDSVDVFNIVDKLFESNVTEIDLSNNEFYDLNFIKQNLLNLFHERHCNNVEIDDNNTYTVLDDSNNSIKLVVRL
jgi:hypothetical protein